MEESSDFFWTQPRETACVQAFTTLRAHADDSGLSRPTQPVPSDLCIASVLGIFSSQPFVPRWGGVSPKLIASSD